MYIKYICIYIYIHTHIYTYMYIYKYIYIYIYTRTSHTYINVYNKCIRSIYNYIKKFNYNSLNLY